MDLKVKLSYLLLLVLLSLLHVTSGLRCYQCRQTTALPTYALYDSVANSNGQCGDWLYTGIRDHDVYCDPDVYNACVKMVMYDNHTQTNYYVYRDCYNSTAGPCSPNADYSLDHAQFGIITGKIYCCSGSYCNPANLNLPSLVTVLSVTMVTTLRWLLGNA